MAYTVRNFKTKKELKEAVARYNTYCADKYASEHSEKANEIHCYNPGLGPDLSNHTGSITLEGPHYPRPHTWYAAGEMVNGVLVKVK